MAPVLTQRSAEATRRNAEEIYKKKALILCVPLRSFVFLCVKKEATNKQISWGYYRA